MISDQLTWFIDGRYFYNNITLDKIIHLAGTTANPIKIIIDARIKSTERWYWHTFFEDTSSNSDALALLNQKKDKLLKVLKMSAIKADIMLSQTSDHINLLNDELSKSKNSLLIVEDAPANKRHPVFQTLTEIDSTVLILSHKAWKKPLKILGAVDPLHEHDRPAKIDDNIVKNLKRWEEAFNLKWGVAHCCYISSVLSKYKNKVLSIHKEALHEFSEKWHIKDEQSTLLDGKPENALMTYIDQEHIDILFIGLVNRNIIDRFWVGSTTSSFLSNPSCDLLLIKH